jgi:two-component system heavy metal sensor histidine kinase CusS
MQAEQPAFAASGPVHPGAASRRPMSLALRLTLLISVAITAIFLGLGWGIEQSIAHHFAVQDAEELGIVRQSLEKELAALPEDASDERIRLQLAGASHGHHNIFYTVIDASGRTLYARPGASLDGLAKRLPVIATLEVEQLSDWRDGVHAYRGGVLSLPSPHVGRGAYTAVVAAETGFHQHFLSSFQRTVWMATGMAVLLAIGAIWLAVYQGHAPLRKVSARIRGISSDQLHLRLEPQNVPIELAGLTLSFNTMLERIEEDFKRLSHFSADIAHELRTPVTNLITQTQVLLSKERGIEAYREALYSSLEEYERMAKMIGDMLYLAQTDNQLIKPDLADVDLHAEVHALFEYFEPWADERQVQLRIQGQTSPVRGDRLMLRRALSNLLSKLGAGRHRRRAGRRRHLRASHVDDTLVAGAGLSDLAATRFVVEHAPEASPGCASWACRSRRKDGQLHLTREGGHSARRIVHVTDATGAAVQRTLIETRAAARRTSRCSSTTRWST